MRRPRRRNSCAPNKIESYFGACNPIDIQTPWVSCKILHQIKMGATRHEDTGVSAGRVSDAAGGGGGGELLINLVFELCGEGRKSTQAPRFCPHINDEELDSLASGSMSTDLSNCCRVTRTRTHRHTTLSLLFFHGGLLLGGSDSGVYLDILARPQTGVHSCSRACVSSSTQSAPIAAAPFHRRFKQSASHAEGACLQAKRDQPGEQNFQPRSRVEG